MLFNWLGFSQRQTLFSEKDIPDLSGRVFIITGGTSGLGLSTAIHLAKKNAHVIITARSREKGEAAMQFIHGRLSETDSLPSGHVEYGIMELEDLQSVNRFVEWFLQKEIPLNVLILNAGIAAVPFKLIQGIESHMFVNHLAHMHLTNLLLDKLGEASDPRIVIVSSDAHWVIIDDKVDWRRVFNREYWNLLDGFRQYGYSKLANILFQRGLVKRLPENSPITVNSLHPGIVATNITQKSILSWISNLVVAPLQMTSDKGALTQVYLATHPDIAEQKMTNGFYIPIAKRGEMSRLAQSDEEAERLWSVSEEILGSLLLQGVVKDNTTGEQASAEGSSSQA